MLAVPESLRGLSPTARQWWTCRRSCRRGAGVRTGQGRKTDTTDAHSLALVATRTTGLQAVVNDEQPAVLRMLVDRPPGAG